MPFGFRSAFLDGDVVRNAVCPLEIFARHLFVSLWVHLKKGPLKLLSVLLINMKAFCLLKQNDGMAS